MIRKKRSDRAGKLLRKEVNPVLSDCQSSMHITSWRANSPFLEGSGGFGVVFFFLDRLYFRAVLGSHQSQMEST